MIAIKIEWRKESGSSLSLPRGSKKEQSGEADYKSLDELSEAQQMALCCPVRDVQRHLLSTTNRTAFDICPLLCAEYIENRTFLI